MPEDEMARAQAATEACDLMLVLGSSLGVYPAAGFPLMACRRGVPLAIINREPTPQDPFAALVIHAGIGPTMRSVIAAL
jgi:NAD-dependent deacetylase